MTERRDINYAVLKLRLAKLHTLSRPDLIMELVGDAIDALDTLQGDLSVANLQLAARVCSECPAKARVEELEAMLATTHGMLQEISKAAGYYTGEAYTASALVARLKDGDR